MNDLSEYKELYLQTAQTLLNEIKLDLNSLEINNSDPQIIEKLHRNFHSLKSQSLVMGFNTLGILNKHLEAMFLRLKEKQITIHKELIDTIYKIVLKMEKSLKHIKETATEMDLSADLAALELLVEV